jgi:hypothetical protein
VVSGLSFALTWDASTHGWAALLRWWDTSKAAPVLRDLLLVGSWPTGENIADQTHREALAAPLAVEAACQAVDLRVRGGLLRNDAEAAIAALTQGSTGSAPMQCQAVRLNRVAYNNELDLILMHVPGLSLVEEGIDGASRTGTHFGPDVNLAHVLGPRVSDGMWASIMRLLEPLRWRVTIDLFAVFQSVRRTRGGSRRRFRRARLGGLAVPALCGSTLRSGLRIPAASAHPKLRQEGHRRGRNAMRGRSAGGSHGTLLAQARTGLRA